MRRYSSWPMETGASVWSSSTTSSSREPERERVSSGSTARIRTIQPAVEVRLDTVEKS